MSSFGWAVGDAYSAVSIPLLLFGLILHIPNPIPCPACFSHNDLTLRKEKSVLLPLANVCLLPRRARCDVHDSSMMWPRVSRLHCPCVRWLALWSLQFLSPQASSSILRHTGSLRSTHGYSWNRQAKCPKQSNRHIYSDILLGSWTHSDGLTRVSPDEDGLALWFQEALNFSGLPKDLLGVTAHLSKT